jgi:hypothetical protein
MKRTSTIFLHVVILLVGIGALTLLLWEPHIEGRNVHATPFEIYFRDPFLAYAYVASIPFFVGLYQAFKVLRYAGQNELFSQAAMKAVRTIRYCAMCVIGFLVGGEAYLFIVRRSEDDIAGGVAVGLFMILVFVAIAAVAAMSERVLQNAVDMKSATDATA